MSNSSFKRHKMGVHFIFAFKRTRNALDRAEKMQFMPHFIVALVIRSVGMKKWKFGCFTVQL